MPVINFRIILILYIFTWFVNAFGFLHNIFYMKFEDIG